MATERFANAPTPSSPSTAWATLTAGINAVTTTIPVSSFAAFPSAAQYRIVIDDEILLVTAGAATLSWTATRGAEGTTAASHSSGASIFHILTAAALLNLPSAVIGSPTSSVQFNNGGVFEGSANVTITTSGTTFNVLSSGDIVLPDVLLGTPLASMPALLAGGVEGALVGLSYVGTGNNRFVLDFGGIQTDTGAIGSERWMFVNNTAPLSGYSGSAYFGIAGNVGAGTVNELSGNTAQVENRGGVITTASAYKAQNNLIPTGSGIGTSIGFLADDQTHGTTRNVGFYSNVSAGATKYAFYGASTAVSHFGGAIDVPAGGLTVGTGVLALSGNFTTTGAFNPTFAIPSSSTWTFPSGGGTLAAPAGTLVIASGKTFTVNNTLTLAGTDAQTYTFPTTSATIARTDAANTFTGVQTMTSPALTTPAIATGAVITEAVGTSGLVITGATQTSNFPSLSMTQTWNNAGTTFGGIFLNVTSTASAAASRLLDLQVGGSSLTYVRKDGFLNTAAVGTNAIYDNGLNGQWASSITFASTSRTMNGVNALSIGSNVGAFADAANVWGQRNGTNAQIFRVYNTFTTLNTAVEYFKFDWQTTANQFRFGAVKGSSTGTARVATWDYGDALASATAAITVPITSGNIVFGGGVTTPGGATFHTTNTALTDGAGVGAGTLGTAPAVGNPTKWIGINDNGTTRYIPAW